MNNIKVELKEHFIRLNQIIGVSGAEGGIAQFISTEISPYCDRVEVLNTGTVLAYKTGKKKGLKAVVSAHMDEIGAIVKSISADGFIHFEKVGDYSNRLLSARKIYIQTKNGILNGIIGMKSAHVMSVEEASKVQTTNQSYIDIGASSKEEAKRMGVAVGDKIVMQSDIMKLNNEDLLCTRAVDDRIGCALIINLFKNLHKEDFDGELIGAFSVMEETTVQGTIASMNYVNPDYIIAIDTVPCGDVPDIDAENELPVYLGKGPVLIVAQGDPFIVRYSCIHPKFRQRFHEIAAEMNMELQELVAVENAYITEQSVAHLCGSGVASASISIPRRYSHTPVELFNINDAVDTYKLLENFLKQIKKEDICFI